MTPPLPDPTSQPTRRVKKPPRKAKKRSGKRQKVARNKAERFEQYDVVSGIVLANAGINTGQLLRGDVKEAAAAAKRLFGRPPSKKVVSAALDISKENVVENHEKGLAGDKRLKLVDGEIYGTAIRVRFDSGAIPNVIPMTLCDKLHLTPRSISRRVRVADGKKLSCLGNWWGCP